MPACGAGAIRIEAIATAGGGRVRRAHMIAIARADEQTVELGAAACAAQIDVTLDDGTSVAPQTGRLRARLVGASGLDATLESTAVDASGVATTVSGHIVLSSSP